MKQRVVHDDVSNTMDNSDVLNVSDVSAVPDVSNVQYVPDVAESSTQYNPKPTESSEVKINDSKGTFLLLNAACIVEPGHSFVGDLCLLKKFIKEQLPDEKLHYIPMSAPASILLRNNDRNLEKAKLAFDATTFIKEYKIEEKLYMQKEANKIMINTAREKRVRKKIEKNQKKKEKKKQKREMTCDMINQNLNQKKNQN